MATSGSSFDLSHLLEALAKRRQTGEPLRALLPSSSAYLKSNKSAAAAKAGKEREYEFTAEEEASFRELVSAMGVASSRYMGVVVVCAFYLVLLVVKRTWGFSVCLGLVTDILNNYAVAALIHAGASHFSAIVNTTGSDIECLMLGLAHIADLYQQLAAVWIGSAIISFTQSAAAWPSASILITGFAAAAAIMRVLDIYAGPVEAHTALTKAAALPLTILRSNFQLMSDDSVDMSALASRIRRTQDLQEQRQALRQAPSFRRGGAGAAELDEFQDAQEEGVEELSAEDVGVIREWITQATAEQAEFEFSKQQERFFKELNNSIRRAESAVSLLCLAAMLDLTVKAVTSDWVNAVPAALDIRAWWTMRSSLHSLNSKFVTIIETEGSDISVLLQAVGRDGKGMTLTRQFVGLRNGAQIVTVGKVIALLPSLVAALGLGALAWVAGPVAAPLRPVVAALQRVGIWDRLVDVMLVAKRIANTFGGLSF